MIRKRLLSFVLAASLIFSLSGCSLLSNRDNNGTDTNTGKINIETESDSEGKDSDNTDLLQDEEVAKKLDEINSLIDYYYYFDTDKESKEEALYDGIMQGLNDPYSVYYTADEYSALQEDSSGEYVGIGAVVTQDKDMVVSVVRPIPGSPAEEAGLMAEDVIVEIDGTAVTNQELSLVVDMIRGKEGTTAHIKVYRKSVSDYIEFDLTRRVVENVSVYSKMLSDDVGYVQVQQFYENTSEEFTAAIDECQNKGAKGIIIDLRDNPGGLLKAVVDMCDYIMEDGLIVSTKDKNGKDLGSYSATGEHSLDIPMVVLVNGNSASASEIFAGAMKDTGKAKLVGTTTFGKGIVQSVIPLSDGTAIKLTVAKYFTPNGSDIHEIGIEPDYKVDLADERTNAVNLEYDDDLQLHKAEMVIQEMLGK